mgnify:CR=1 FL=1
MRQVYVDLRIRITAERIRGEAEEKARTLYEEQKKLGYEEGARCREEELNREHEKAMESLHAQKKQLEEQYEYKLTNHNLYFEGYCKVCKDKNYSEEIL